MTLIHSSVTPEIQERFFAKVNLLDPSGCWTWSGKPDNGYGRFAHSGKSRLAHRVALEILDPLKLVPGNHTDHLCRNRGCVNPDHLESVPIATNVLRGTGRSAVNARKMKCDHGHALEGENLYINPSGSRNCRICLRRATQEWRARQKEQM